MNILEKIENELLKLRPTISPEKQLLNFLNQSQYLNINNKHSNVIFDGIMRCIDPEIDEKNNIYEYLSIDKSFTIRITKFELREIKNAIISENKNSYRLKKCDIHCDPIPRYRIFVQ